MAAEGKDGLILFISLVLGASSTDWWTLMLKKVYTLKIIDVKRGPVIKTFKREVLSLSLNRAAGGWQMWSLLLVLEGRV